MVDVARSNMIDRLAGRQERGQFNWPLTPGSEDARPSPGAPLLPLKESKSLAAPDHLPFTRLDYLELVDWSGRAVREHKHGHIDFNLPPILHRLGVSAGAYLDTLQRHGDRFRIAMGAANALQRAAERLRQRYIRETRRLFPVLAT